MSRKPIDQQQPTECRQAIWEWIRTHSKHPFVLRDIDVFLDIDSIRDYVTGLQRAGYLTVVKSHKRAAPAIYTFARDNGIEAPRVRKNGTAVTQGQGRRQMWNAMQVLKVFSPRDLAFNASTPAHGVAEGEARTYCQILCHAGYLVVRDVTRYALVPAKWTGPQPPQIQRTKQLYDPNLKKVVWSRVEGGAE